MCVMWFCATGSILKGVFSMVYTIQAYLFPYSLKLYSKTEKIMLLSLTQKLQINPKPHGRLLLLLEKNMYFSHFKWLLKWKMTDAFYSISL